MIHEVKSIEVFHAALVLALVNFVLGILTAIVMAVAPMGSMMPGHPGMLFSLPLGYAVGAFVVSAVGCAVYNVIARFTGGIEIELSTEASETGQSSAAGR
jgi:hypothetical protein